MRTQSRRRSRAYLDQVLEGRASGPDPLIDLVRQIQAPPRRRETRGLRPASSAFAWAPSVRPYLPPHHRTGLTSMAAHLWHPKVLAGGLTLVAVTAIAYATTGAATTQHSPTTITSADVAAKMSAASASAASAAAKPHPSSNSAGKVVVAPSRAGQQFGYPNPVEHRDPGEHRSGIPAVLVPRVDRIDRGRGSEQPDLCVLDQPGGRDRRRSTVLHDAAEYRDAPSNVRRHA